MRRGASRMVVIGLLLVALAGPAAWFGSPGLRAWTHLAAFESGLPRLQQWGLKGVLSEEARPYDFLLYAEVGADRDLCAELWSWWRRHSASEDFEPEAYMAALARGLGSRKLEQRRLCVHRASRLFEANVLLSEELEGALIAAAEDDDARVREGVIKGLVGGDLARLDELRAAITKAAGDDRGLQAYGELTFFALRQRQIDEKRRR